MNLGCVCFSYDGWELIIFFLLGMVNAGGITRLPANVSNKRRRVPSNQPVIDCEHAPVNVVELNMSPVGDT